MWNLRDTVTDAIANGTERPKIWAENGKCFFLGAIPSLTSCGYCHYLPLKMLKIGSMPYWVSLWQVKWLRLYFINFSHVSISTPKVPYLWFGIVHWYLRDFHSKNWLNSWKSSHGNSLDSLKIVIIIILIRLITYLHITWLDCLYYAQSIASVMRWRALK